MKFHGLSCIRIMRATAGFGRPNRAILILAGTILLGAGGATVRGSEGTALPELDSIRAFYVLPAAEAQRPHHFSWDLDVLFYDPDWNLLWVGEGEFSTWLSPGNRPLPIQSGQRIRAEGELDPTQALSLGNARIAVVPGGTRAIPLDTAGDLANGKRFTNYLVKVEAVIDRQEKPDPSHLMLEGSAEGLHVVIRVRVDPSAVCPKFENAVVAATGVYVAESNFSGGLKSVAIWVPQLDALQVRSWLRDDAQFAAPVVPIEEIAKQSSRRSVLHVAGTVHAFDNNNATVTLRDTTGQVVVSTAQTRDIRVGSRFEAVGLAEVAGVQLRLRDAVIKLVESSPRPTARLLHEGLPLRLADEVLALKPDEADRGYPVQIFGVATWVDPEQTVMFVQDVTRGIEVVLPTVEKPLPDLPCAVRVVGRTSRGAFAPLVDATEVVWNNPLGSPEPRVVTLEQMMTGSEHGRWIAIQAYLRAVRKDSRSTQLDLTTSSGEFVAWMPPDAEVAALPGALVTIYGVCSVISNDRRQLAGVRVLVPSAAWLIVDEVAPSDPFEVPVSSIAGLREFGLAQFPLRRVRTSGIVLYHDPGQFICIQDESEALLVLSRETVPLVPGDRVETVGIPGREGGRVVLREASYRRIGSGPEPAPKQVANLQDLGGEIDGKLVGLRGLLVGIQQHALETVVTVQADNRLFDAAVPEASFDQRWQPGCVVAVKGVYRAKYDEYHKAIGFSLQMRSGGDLQVLAHPPLWTVPRALAAAAALGLLAAAVLGWLAVLRNRVAKQTEQIRQQLEKQARLEAELQRAERIESLGLLAGGIGHDFNNLLTIVLGNLSLALMDERAVAVAGPCLLEAERGAKRAGDLTQQLLIFSKGGNPTLAAVRLPEFVRETVKFALHGANVRCDFECPPDLWAAEVDRVQIGQVIQNLTINASQAMAAGGTLRVSLLNVELAPDAVVSLPAGRYVRLIVADTGEGIKPELLSRIFDPYFTTKKKGRGLGLATVYTIVKKHGGHIDVQSELGKGTVFRIWLQASKDRPRENVATVSTPPIASSPSPAPVRILIMDDEAGIRRAAGVALLRRGYEVTTVADGREAIEEFSLGYERRRPYSLVILDLTIPGEMGGKEAVVAIRQIDPGIRVIVSSGYSNDPVVAGYRAFGFDATLPKPYQADQLVAVVDKTLARITPRNPETATQMGSNS